MRYLADADECYRVKVVTTWPPNDERDEPLVGVSYVGPYGSLRVARSQVTRLESERRRWGGRAETVTTIEKASTAWEEVP